MATKAAKNTYSEDSIKTLHWRDHIRTRPGMYIGKLGDGKAPDDGIYILFKEIIDNGIDEFIMGAGKEIRIDIEGHTVTVRDFGRGIPLGKLVDCVGKINTGGKYDSEAFQKSVGLNGIGSKATNALSASFFAQSFRDGKSREAEFKYGKLIRQGNETSTKEPNGTLISFTPDPEIFQNYNWIREYLDEKMWMYAYLNPGLVLYLNGTKYFSRNGLHDLLVKEVNNNTVYPIVHFKDNDIEAAITHCNQPGEEYYSFVNGQYTTDGGTHLAAFREGVLKACKEFFNKDFNPHDIRSSIIGCIAIRIQEPVFESQTKTKLGSITTEPNGPSLKMWIIDFVRKHFIDHLYKNKEVAQALLSKIQRNERERKDMAGVRKLANERAKKANVHNKKLRDCKVHYNTKDSKRSETMIFITEGDSASGSITKSRHVSTQAVFGLKGKPLNCFGMKKKVVYENEEFNLLQHALNIEEGIEGLRYNKIIIATDADVDGAHIRLLLLTFFLQFFPELVRRGHVFILQTPLFRVRNKKETHYCYDESEKISALTKLGKTAEITRFKGLGEISPSEFEDFIGENIRLEPVLLESKTQIKDMLRYYMGKNSPERKAFLIDNLRIEEDVPLEELETVSEAA
ncbi:MAG: type IIA DNA topoisomerase subunit B [Fibrobacteria bacterium]|nr:type IIA DNA topoisomerase subunit B [Fibrobacteria bacterium]